MQNMALNYLRQKPKKFLFDGCKLHYHQDRLQEFLEGKRITPIHIDMGIHKDCNIRCIYCYGIKQKPSRLYIPRDRLMMLAQDAKDAGVKSLAIIGDGEPTLNKGLYPFVEKLASYGVDASVATNGLELNERELEVLTSSLVWLRFNVSAVDNNYEKIHRGANNIGGWKRFKRNVAYAVKHKGKCTVGLQMVCIPQCFKDIIPLAEYALDAGVDYLVVKQFSDPEEGIPITFDIKKEYEIADDALRYVESLSNDTTTIVVKWSAMRDSGNITGQHHWEFDRCIDLPFIFQISGNGGCYPCGYLFNSKEHCYGNVCDTRLWDILHSEHYWNIIKKIADTPLAQLCKGQCRHCETNKFMDRLSKISKYEGDLEKALVRMCGSKQQYQALMDNPPEHRNFI